MQLFNVPPYAPPPRAMMGIARPGDVVTLPDTTQLESTESTNSVLSNCVVSGNVTTSPGRAIPIIARGGGAYGGTLNNCILSGNNAFGIGFYGDFDGDGGGACNAILNNCTLTRNSAVVGGGASSCTLNNCHLIGNSVRAQGQFGDEYGSGGGASGSTLNNCTLTGN